MLQKQENINIFKHFEVYTGEILFAFVAFWSELKISQISNKAR